MNRQKSRTGYRLPIRVLMDYAQGLMSDYEEEVLAEYLRKNPDEREVVDGIRLLFVLEDMSREEIEEYLAFEGLDTGFISDHLDYTLTQEVKSILAQKGHQDQPTITDRLFSYCTSHFSKSIMAVASIAIPILIGCAFFLYSHRPVLPSFSKNIPIQRSTSNNPNETDSYPISDEHRPSIQDSPSPKKHVIPVQTESPMISLDLEDLGKIVNSMQELNVLANQKLSDDTP